MIIKQVKKNILNLRLKTLAAKLFFNKTAIIVYQMGKVSYKYPMYN